MKHSFPMDLLRELLINKLSRNLFCHSNIRVSAITTVRDTE